MLKKIMIVLFICIVVGLSGISIYSVIEGKNLAENRQNMINEALDNKQVDSETEKVGTIGGIKEVDVTITVDADEKAFIVNPDDILVVANKSRNLPADYSPTDLVIPDIPWPFSEVVEKKYLRQEAAEAVEALFKKANEDGMNLYAQSGYRSYTRQVSVFGYNVNKKGKEEANKLSAMPGQSEHQTGLALDVTSPEVNFELIEEFGETKEGKWLKENAAEFGFIIRYLKGKEDITGYEYEPWHIRYVGVKAAKEIAAKNETLEEYLGLE